MNKVKVNLDNLTEEEIAELLKLIEKANNPKSKVWKPEKGEEYYYFWAGRVYSCSWNNDFVDEGKYAIADVFKTKEEAQNAVERLKIRAELQRYADEHNEPIDWGNDKQDKWYIKFNYWNKTVDYDYFAMARGCFQIYFSSEEIAKAAVQAVGEERIKKYLFEVEE